MLLALLIACTTSPGSRAFFAPAPVDQGGEEEAGDSGGADPQSVYEGPDYEPCVTDAQCEAGSWCTEVPGHAAAYCAPPCDPAGDGTECAMEGVAFETSCLDNGRCARACPEDEVATEDAETGELIASPGDSCPEGLACQAVEDDGLGETTVCAGALAGGAGYYGTCTHPNVDGPDCPELSSCFGGSYIGLEDAGICLPWCDEGTCPVVPDGVTALPLCYDVGLDHPICVLLCTPDESVCPEEQVCMDFGYAGLCVPEGTDTSGLPI